jgi:hypothetical protein
MENRPVTVTFLTIGALWALWHWRRRRLETGPGITDPRTGTGPAPLDAGAKLAEVTG